MWLPRRMGYEPTASLHGGEPVEPGPDDGASEGLDDLEGEEPLDLDDLEGDEPLNLDDLEGEDGLDELEGEEGLDDLDDLDALDDVDGGTEALGTAGETP